MIILKILLTHSHTYNYCMLQSLVTNFIHFMHDKACYYNQYCIIWYLLVVYVRKGKATVCRVFID